MADWNPSAYAAFADLRLRPALDLIAHVPDLPAGGIADLGCGAGAVGPALRARWPGRRLTGIDASPAMLAGARATRAYDALAEADLAAWAPDRPPALIVANAALNWVPDHAALLPALAGRLAPGGVLAAQVPGQHDAPSHRMLREVAAGIAPGRIGAMARPFVLDPRAYARILAPLGAADLWETTYLQRLGPASGHPVAAFTAATAMRPVLAALSPDEAARFTARYEAAMEEAYPREADGSVLFPFRRIFLILKVPPCPS